jgi:uncharacterized integral membrane protein
VRLSSVIILAIVAIIAAMIAVANRQIVTFSLDPLSTNYPSVAFTLPLWLLVFLAMLFGVLLGGASVALNRSTRRRRTREFTPVGEHALTPAEARPTREATTPYEP